MAVETALIAGCVSLPTRSAIDVERGSSAKIVRLLGIRCVRHSRPGSNALACPAGTS
ncbi:hypothetical protein C8E05_7057 [Rhodococcus wratislaviensis]|uniref:Uncharacterized protein n=1 Tax=Rhodococcus wratislaviensis TaxID=44752 RepID=A0AB38F7B2_RHOWR|nr:hypothetical protein [Rhodococcus wratislaviensis]REE77533.1 hypothetical protein C8E05_7057 [Rhodococcus wratislaviensis]SPZ35315.1 Uncharacterised protein [Rhodococcus wratislaviensis]